MSTSFSPLRYPGGKQVLGKVIARLVCLNNREGGTYVEPYAGGAGAALMLLFGDYVRSVSLNDADWTVYCFWKSVLDDTESFLRLIRDTPLTIDEWRRQRAIYKSPSDNSPLQVGFATFFLNRTNRSGIIVNGGPIGGIDQRGKWTVDARFYRSTLSKRVEKIALYRERISICNQDALDFLRDRVGNRAFLRSAFVYLDPPYFAKGRDLYLSFYAADDHRAVSRFILSTEGLMWVMSYDNVPEVARLYRTRRCIPFSLSYTARERRSGAEILIVGKGVRFPREWRKSIPPSVLKLAL